MSVDWIRNVMLSTRRFREHHDNKYRFTIWTCCFHTAQFDSCRGKRFQASRCHWLIWSDKVWKAWHVQTLQSWVIVAPSSNEELPILEDVIFVACMHTCMRHFAVVRSGRTVWMGIRMGRWQVIKRWLKVGTRIYGSTWHSSQGTVLRLNKTQTTWSYTSISGKAMQLTEFFKQISWSIKISSIRSDDDDQINEGRDNAHWVRNPFPIHYCRAPSKAAPSGSGACVANVLLDLVFAQTFLELYVCIADIDAQHTFQLMWFIAKWFVWLHCYLTSTKLWKGDKFAW